LSTFPLAFVFDTGGVISLDRDDLSAEACACCLFLSNSTDL
jgi:hypothetical protein